MSKKRPVRELVLDAAVDLVEASGAGLLTLDAVAARAGVSKGGLLHHFKSKEALLTAMIERLANTFEEEKRLATSRLDARAGNTAEDEVELVTTYINRAFSGLGTRNNSAMPLLAGAAHQPSLLQPIREYFERRNQDALDYMANPKPALVLMLLADGIWMFDALGIPPLTGELREEVRQFVIEWAQKAIMDGRDGQAAAAPAAGAQGKPKKKRVAT